MTSINDQWKFQEATINAVRKSMNNGNPQAMIKRMIASERSRPTGQRAQPILNFTIATQGGQPRDYDQEINEREFAIEKENVAVENDQLNGTQEAIPIAFDFKLTHQVKQTLMKEINELIKESQYIFSGDVNVIKFVDIFQKFNDMSMSYNEYISDIIRDVNFARLWHTKLVNLETIFERIGQRLKDIDSGRYSGADSVRTSGAYSIPYLLEIIIQAKKVIEMMLLNKNTTQYLSIATAPQPTYITEGQIESSPQDELNTGYDPLEDQRLKDEQTQQDEDAKLQRKADEKRQRRDEEWRHQAKRDSDKRRQKLEDRLNKLQGILEQQAIIDVDRETDTDEEIRAKADRKAKIEAEQERARIELEALEKSSSEADLKREQLSNEVEISSIVAKQLLDEVKAHKLLPTPTDQDERDAFLDIRRSLTAQYNSAERESRSAKDRLDDFNAGIDVPMGVPGKSGEEDIEGAEEEKTSSGDEVPVTIPDDPDDSAPLELDYKAAAIALADKCRTNPAAGEEDYYVFLRDNIGPFFYGDKLKPTDITRTKEDKGILKIAKLKHIPLTRSSKSGKAPSGFYEAYKSALGSKPGVYINPVTPEILTKVSIYIPKPQSADFISETTSTLVDGNK